MRINKRVYAKVAITEQEREEKEVSEFFFMPIAAKKAGVRYDKLLSSVSLRREGATCMG